MRLDDFLGDIGFEGTLACDGNVQRYGRKGNKWVWSLQKGDDVFAVAGDWSTGEKVHFGERTHGIKREMEKLGRERAEKAEDAARHARNKWEHLRDKPLGRTYLERKGVAGFGVRYNGCDIYVPMRRGGEIVGLQRIAPDGTKRFTPGCAKKGASHRIERPVRPGEAKLGAVLCEGYATGASIHMATGRPVVIAFDCNNLGPAAAWHQDIEIVAADNDATPGNPGMTAASHVAAERSYRVVWPSTAGLDFNDVHSLIGLPALRALFA